MVLFRALGWLLLALSIAVAVRDALTWWSEGAFHPLSLGDLWLLCDFGSLQSLEGGVTRRLPAAVWVKVAAPLLKIPTLPVSVVLGLMLLWLGQRRDGRGGEPGFVLGSRPPRRRRRGSLS